MVCDARNGTQRESRRRCWKIEVYGVIGVFKRSEELHSAKFGFYMEDGDTKTFKTLVEAKSYGDDLTVKKKARVLYVKKMCL